MIDEYDRCTNTYLHHTRIKHVDSESAIEIILASSITEKRFLVSFPAKDASGSREWAERTFVLGHEDLRSRLLRQWKRDCLSFIRNYLEKYGDDLAEVQDVTALVHALYAQVVGHTEIDD